MSRIRFGVGMAVLVALAMPVSALAQGDPAPRGGAGTNLPGAAGAAAAAAAEARASNTVINTAPVTTTPAGAPNTADVRTNLREATREGPASPFEMHRRLEAIREGRTTGADAAATSSAWYSQPIGTTAVISRQMGPTGGAAPMSRPLDAGWCLGYYEQVWGPQGTWGPNIVTAASGCSDGALSRAVSAWNNRTPSRIGSGDFYDPRMYWGSPSGSGMGYSQRSGGFSRTYADAGLKLDVKPTDARVYVDGFYAGQVADFDGQIRRLPLNPGSHRVEFVANGLEPLVIAAEVADGQTATFSGQLTRKK